MSQAVESSVLLALEYLVHYCVVPGNSHTCPVEGHSFGNSKGLGVQKPKMKLKWNFQGGGAQTNKTLYGRGMDIF